MSAEFYTGYSESDINTACKKAEEVFLSAESPKQFFDSLQTNYAESPNGKAELHRMLRVARFITNPQNDPSNDQAVAAFFYGELAATDLLSHLGAHSKEPANYAHEFLEYRLKKTRPKGKGVEDSRRMRRRHDQVSQDIRIELIDEDADLPNVYEDYINKIAVELRKNETPTHYTIMGFRLIIKEFLSPSKNRDTEEIIGMTARVPYLMHDDLNDYKSSPTIEELNEVLNDPGDFYVESIEKIQKAIQIQYQRELSAFREINLNDQASRTAIKKFWEAQLRKLNNENELLSKEDLLMISGDFFAIISDGNESSTVLFNQFTEIRGWFDDIVIVDAPSNKSLLSVMSSPENSNKEALITPVPTPAIRLANPTFFEYDQYDNQIVNRAHNLHVDIPIFYKHVDFQRVLPLDFKS